MVTLPFFQQVVLDLNFSLPSALPTYVSYLLVDLQSYLANFLYYSVEYFHQAGFVTSDYDYVTVYAIIGTDLLISIPLFFTVLIDRSRTMLKRLLTVIPDNFETFNCLKSFFMIDIS